MSVIIRTDRTFDADNETLSQVKRPIFLSLRRGLKGRCPNCGQGKLFSAYLKVNDTCPVCAEELFHHRADDAPPYITILLVGHILVGLMLELEMNWSLPPMFYIFTMVPLAIVLPLLLLPPIKGAIVGLQWANRMHGFDPENEKKFPT